MFKTYTRKRGDNMKCPHCNSEILKGWEQVSITLNDNSSVLVLVSVFICGECEEFCKIEAELY